MSSKVSENSPAFQAIVTMIEKSWMVMELAELINYLETLEQRGFLTLKERTFLMTLAIKKMKT